MGYPNKFYYIVSIVAQVNPSQAKLLGQNKSLIIQYYQFHYAKIFNSRIDMNIYIDMNIHNFKRQHKQNNLIKVRTERVIKDLANVLCDIHVFFFVSGSSLKLYLSFAYKRVELNQRFFTGIQFIGGTDTWSQSLLPTKMFFFS